MTENMPHIDVTEAAARVGDGSAVIVDTSAAALALVITQDGTFNVRSGYDNMQIAQMLRQVADRAEARYNEGTTRG